MLNRRESAIEWERVCISLRLPPLSLSLTLRINISSPSLFIINTQRYADVFTIIVRIISIMNSVTALNFCLLVFQSWFKKLTFLGSSRSNPAHPFRELSFVHRRDTHAVHLRLFFFVIPVNTERFSSIICSPTFSWSAPNSGVIFLVVSRMVRLPYFNCNV